MHVALSQDEGIEAEEMTRETRNSRASKDVKTVEFADLTGGQADADGSLKVKDGNMLLITFVSMVFIGLGNKVFNKLMTIPMHNYPNFLNLLTTFVCKCSLHSHIIINTNKWMSVSIVRLPTILHRNNKVPCPLHITYRQLQG
jgi:CRT-like, chloroquine-resistance transporter-like